MPKIERRIFTEEARAESSGKGTYAAGLAAPHGNIYPIGGPQIRETLQRGCFDSALRRSDLDVRCTYNHSRERVPLGRTTAGTLKLRVDDEGLHYRALLPQSADDVKEALERGDVRHSSFAFVMPDDGSGQEWSDETDEDGQPYALRTITQIESLHDVSVVDDPANAASTAELAGRSFLDSMPAELRSRYASRAIDDDPADSFDDTCDCDCAECIAGACDDCSDPDCTDENCRCAQSMQNSRSGAGDGGKDTKKVDGEELPQSAFLIHGSSDDKASWKLPVRFSTLAKSEKHVRLAIDLFSTLKDVPEDEKTRAWKELEALAEKYGIKIDNEDDARARELDLELAALD